MWSNVGSESRQHMLMVKEQSNCKAGMRHYGIFGEVFIRGSEVLPRSCQKRTGSHDPPSSC